MPQEVPQEEVVTASTSARRAWWTGPAAALLLGAPTLANGDDVQQLRTRGEYVLRASGCVACHTDLENHGRFLAGGRALATRFGVFYSPNITFHPEHGIGAWDLKDFIAALRHGVAPDGSDYYPVFPYTSYTRMLREDMIALYAYLATVPHAARRNRPHELSWYMDYRIVNWAWKLLFFESGTFRPDSSRSPSWNRGAYLATALAHCGECHTPGTRYGKLDQALAYAGRLDGPDGDAVPNITPDPETGIGHWSRRDLVDYLSSGLTPDGDSAGGLMAEVIDEGLAHLNREDLEAIGEYIMTLAPIENEVGGNEAEEKDDLY